MPVMDGLTATKTIRQIEQEKSASCLSSRATLNGRVPIIAVSASLIEAERQTYIDAGFDAWILKPISFNRLGELMNAIVDPKIRDECLYKPGEWEKGGWFEKAKPVKPTPKIHVDGKSELQHVSFDFGGLKSQSAPQLRHPDMEDQTDGEVEAITDREPVQSPEATE
jgi:CheY-like chemotaxis protein